MKNREHVQVNRTNGVEQKSADTGSVQIQDSDAV